MKSLNDIAAQCCLGLEKLVRIEEYILNTGYLSAEKVRRELEWFVLDLGIDEYYFRTTSEIDIARHLIALSASELITAHGGGGGIQLTAEQEDKAVYIVEDLSAKTLEIEGRIERAYPAFHLESYPTRASSHGAPLRFYILTKPVYRDSATGSTGFGSAASEIFRARAVPETAARYREVWERMAGIEAPYVSVSYKKETDETRIMIGVKGIEQRRILTTLAHLSSKYELKVSRKYVEPFVDGKKITSLYFPRIADDVLNDLTRDLNVSLMIPEGTIAGFFREGRLSPQAAMYAVCAAAFTHQFLSLLTDDYLTLQRALRDQPEARGIVDSLKMHLTKDSYSTTRIAACAGTHAPLVERIFDHFRAARYAPDMARCVEPGNADSAAAAAAAKAIEQTIDRDVPYSKDRAILRYFLLFNGAVQRTNFFRVDKSCMAFRLDPAVVDPVDFPERPFGIFFLVGHDFIGFHIRFRDIARGGVRIVRSRTPDAYAHNIDTIFTENYNLALTQQRKNKDIPEGGSKGALLLNPDCQAAADRAFKDYVDGLLDLLVVDAANGKAENGGAANGGAASPREATGRDILFLGPDEGSAHLMDWAGLHARARGYPFWKGFSTGKAPELGGVPHDLYGMTTIGVHEYVIGALEKLKLQEEAITKIQTGGPDGDLGSNEIVISRDRTIGVVDGSGVLYDPAGLDRSELERLARKRVMVQEFDAAGLSKAGFFVSVNDRDITLPDGTSVVNGEEFRNSFHLSRYAAADLFVPCGGRPAAVNIANWKELLDEGGRPKFALIVEGANLFLTEEARLRLEERGVVVLKDASTNKGGVTSSSYEVLAGLALSEDEYDRHMRVENGAIPPFRAAYVEDIIRRIKANARAEFELLWREREATKTPLTVLSNQISGKINQIADAVRDSPLADDPVIRERLLAAYVPAPLRDLVGLTALAARVPAAYLKAAVAAQMATDFVYGRGLRANEVDFADYVEGLKRQA